MNNLKLEAAGCGAEVVSGLGGPILAWVSGVGSVTANIPIPLAGIGAAQAAVRTLDALGAWWGS